MPLKLPLTYEPIMGRILDADGEPVCMVYAMEETENARSILQACNSHEELLAALQVLVLTPHILYYLEANDPMALEQARAAIAKANDIN